MKGNSVVIIENIIDDFLPFTVDIDLSADPIILPLFTGESFEVHSSTGVDWRQHFKTQHHSSAMWLFSLQTLGRLLSNHLATGNHAPLDTCVRVLNNFFDHFSKPENESDLWQVASADHSTATRVRVLIKFFNVLYARKEQDTELLNKIVTHLKACSDWLLQDSNYRKNNHGLMSSSSLLHTATFFNGEEFADQHREIAVKRVIELVRESYDKDSYCNENTVGYHRFNLHLYTVLMKFCSTYRIDDLVVFLQDHIERATEALRYCIRQDGTVPPIGDSPVYSTGVSSINRSKFFEESCFGVVKNDDLYLSIVCGGPSEIHKQVDDSSITLRYKNNDVVTDGGSYLYDRTNPHRRCIESANGHSGLFLKAFDGLLRSQYVRKFGPLTGRIHLFEESADGVRIYCSYGIQDEKTTFHRHIYVKWPDEVAIVDHVNHSDAQTGASPVACVQRFLFAPDLVLLVEKRDTFHLVGDSMNHTLIQLGDCSANLYKGESGDNYRGWHSCKNNEILPVAGIDFTTKSPSPRFAVIFKLSQLIAGIEGVSDGIRVFAEGADPFFERAWGVVPAKP